MTVNTARFEESSEIVIDQEVETGDTGWTIIYASVNRVGSLVAVHLELSSLAAAAAAVLTLQPDFAPGATVTDSTGKFTIDDVGNVVFTGSTVAANPSEVCQFVYQAGEVSP